MDHIPLIIKPENIFPIISYKTDLFSLYIH